MATTGIVNGHLLRLYVDGTAVAKATECSVSLAMSPREVAHKDTTGAAGGWKEIEPGQRSGSLSTSALYEEADSMDALFTAFDAGTTIAFKYSTEVVGDKRYTGNGLITALDMNAPDNENVTYTVNIEIDGAVTRDTVV